MTRVTPIRDLRGYHTPEQIETFIVAATNPRDKAFIAILTKNGIRISEAIQVKASDIDLQKDTLTIMHLKEKSKLRCPHCRETLSKRTLITHGAIDCLLKEPIF